MQPTESNPRGYYESQPLFGLHEELLAAAGTSWDDLSGFPTGWIHSPVARRWIERLTEAVRSEFGASDFFVLKDPRVCRLVPLWKQVLARAGVTPHFVIMTRNPLEIGESLYAVHQMDRRKASLLWVDHFLSAERETRRLLRSFVTYDALLTDWRSALDRIAADLGIAFPRRSRAAEAEIDDFLTAQLRHHRAAPEELSIRGDIADWVRTVWSWALQATEGETPKASALDRVAREFRKAEAAFGPLLASAELAGSKGAAELERLQVELGERRSEVADLNAEISRARSEVQVHGDQAASLEHQLAAREHEVGQLIESIKFILQSVATLTTRAHPGEASMEIVYQALSHAEPSTVPQLATTALQISQQSVEIQRLVEESASRARAVEELTAGIENVKVEAEERLRALESVGAHAERLESQLADGLAELERARQDSSQQAEEIARLAAEAEEIRGVLHECRAQLGSGGEALRDAQTECSRLGESAERLEAELSRAREEAKILRSQNGDLKQLRGDKARELGIAGERSAEQDAELGRLRSELSARDQSLCALQRELQHAKGLVTERDLYLAQLRSRIDRAETSLTWKVSRPARALARGVSAVFGD